ncbi:T3SS effector HopA1 family protein [Pectobacterium cacticida]|uniref:T3SS effector HopA1 family protein n=1 Tax=Pectobacterium cacticida TaxID=69221 RepID=A0ABZ2G893_9GAMM|nr:T3SS effector HopA1 family protein [Pectobacterium cacticida]UYX08360.1 T3SS effector HopA1 family protein [Pectobacterium cacticida]
MNFEQQLKQLSERVHVTGTDSYQIDGKAHTVFHNYAWSEYSGPLNLFGHNHTHDVQQRKQLLESQLSVALYTKIYCGIPDDKKLLNLPTCNEREIFMQTLSSANASQETPDQNWRIYHVDAQGVWTEKNGKLRQAYPNSFIPATPNAPLVINQYIHFLRQKENRHIQQVFYYVHSNHYMEHDAPQVRIYWNIMPEGAASLVAMITEVLNAHHIAFNFKCLNHPDLYHRADSAVLYLEKRYFDYTLRVLKPHIPTLEKYLLDTLPLFTQAISKGISFAEDPGNGQSFGMHRCQLIAKGLLTAYEKKQIHGSSLTADQMNLACIVDEFNNKGIAIGRLHLNPNTMSLPVDVSEKQKESAL